MSAIHEFSDKDALVIFGVVIDESAGDEISVTLIATNFDTPKNGNFSQSKPSDSQGIQSGVVEYGVFESLTHPSALNRRKDSAFADLSDSPGSGSSSGRSGFDGGDDSKPPFSHKKNILLD
jgi:hypothetical protein